MVLQIRLVVVVVVACSWRGVGVINTHELGLVSSSHHHHLLSIWTPLTASADSPGTFWDKVSVFVIIFSLPLLVSVIIVARTLFTADCWWLPSLRSRHMEIMSARKNDPRDGNTRGEKELPLPLRVSLARPVLSYEATSKRPLLRLMVAGN